MKKCLFCGFANEDDTLFCSGCGRKFPVINKKVHNSISDEKINDDEVLIDTPHKQLCCPKCKSTHLQATVETSTSTRTTGNSYSLAKGCLGSMVFGTTGWIFGALGQHPRTAVETKNRDYWICTACGTKFRNTCDWRKEIEEKGRSLKVNLMLAIIIVIIAVLLFTGSELSALLGVVFLIIAIVNGVVFLAGKTKIEKEYLELEELERTSTK